MLKALIGYRTYITAGLMIAHAISAMCLGSADFNTGGQEILEAVAIMFVRGAIK